MLSRARDALLGLACGDSLGATLEFMPREDVRRKYPGGLRDLVGGGPFGWAPGETTDDTAMALCVLRGILKAGGGDADVQAIVEAVGQEFVAWFRSGPKDVGATTAMALQTYLREKSWERTSAQVRRALGDRAAGNGALMRTLPVAFFWPDNPKKTVEVARAIVQMTHPHPHAEWCAAVYSLYAARILVEGSGAPAVQWRQSVRAHRVAAPELAAQVLDVEDRLDYRRVVSLDEDVIRSTGYCVDTLEAALWAFWTSDSAEECIVKAANLGGDADTVAAVAGGLAGAAWGRAGLPGRWMQVLSEYVREEVDSLVALTGMKAAVGE